MTGGLGAEDLGAADLDRLIETTARAAEQAARAAEPAEPPEVRHEAADRDGLVRAAAVLTPEGVRLRSLTLNPRVRRLESEQLAALLQRTVNEALDGVAAAAGDRAAPGLAALSAELRELQAYAADRFGVFAGTVGDVLRQLDRRIEE
ncbi:hypothetical protein MF672_032170 [Actinomadura sp. ATCC 31491]|uniref:YbaB/EbfC family DNA-binding protein n=1 Tax=Actinomadura luzonensis TaxID=2805427 RepID=A0ABT0G1C8_9ACTN|nr:hypothetical protein [Actinomadura luzonensis]MCK2218417.1 hypothetical protein [Actinomadura luzonensis]